MKFTLHEIEHICKRYNLQFHPTGANEYQLFLQSDIFWVDAYYEYGGYLAPLAEFKINSDIATRYTLTTVNNSFLLRDFQIRQPYFCLFRAVTPAEKSHGDIKFLNTEFTYISHAIQFMNYIHWVLDTIPEAAKYLKQYKQNKLIEQINKDFV